MSSQKIRGVKFFYRVVSSFLRSCAPLCFNSVYHLYLISDLPLGTFSFMLYGFPGTRRSLKEILLKVKRTDLRIIDFVVLITFDKSDSSTAACNTSTSFYASYIIWFKDLQKVRCLVMQNSLQPNSFDNLFISVLFVLLVNVLRVE